MDRVAMDGGKIFLSSDGQPSTTRSYTASLRTLSPIYPAPAAMDVDKHSWICRGIVVSSGYGMVMYLTPSAAKVVMIVGLFYQFRLRDTLWGLSIGLRFPCPYRGSLVQL